MKHHPGTEVYTTHHFADWFSLENIWHQVNEIGADLMTFCDLHPEGVHLLGYSQGGIIARGILESHPNHCVKKFISLSSPQAGQYGSKSQTILKTKPNFFKFQQKSSRTFSPRWSKKLPISCFTAKLASTFQ